MEVFALTEGVDSPRSLLHCTVLYYKTLLYDKLFYSIYAILHVYQKNTIMIESCFIRKKRKEKKRNCFYRITLQGCTHVDARILTPQDGKGNRMFTILERVNSIL